MRRGGLPFLVLAVGVGALGGAMLGGEKSRVALLNHAGFIETGEKFGVSVGDRSTDVPAILVSDNFRFIDAHFGGLCLRRRYAETDKVHVYVDDSWRKITLCLAERGDRIVSVQWDAAPLRPEL